MRLRVTFGSGVNVEFHKASSDEIKDIIEFPDELWAGI